MYVQPDRVHEAMPLAGCVLVMTVMVSPSGSVSLASTGSVTSVSNGVLALSSPATGGRSCRRPKSWLGRAPPAGSTTLRLAGVVRLVPAGAVNDTV